MHAYQLMQNPARYNQAALRLALRMQQARSMDSHTSRGRRGGRAAPTTEICRVRKTKQQVIRNEAKVSPHSIHRAPKPTRIASKPVDKAHHTHLVTLHACTRLEQNGTLPRPTEAPGKQRKRALLCISAQWHTLTLIADNFCGHFRGGEAHPADSMKQPCPLAAQTRRHEDTGGVTVLPRGRKRGRGRGAVARWPSRPATHRYRICK